MADTTRNEPVLTAEGAEEQARVQVPDGVQVDTIEVPAGARHGVFEVVGGLGGFGTAASGAPGNGALVRATVPVTGGEKLQAVVGTAAYGREGGTGIGSFPGGRGGSGNTGGGRNGGGGGGASGLARADWRLLIVAGGGGGAGGGAPLGVAGGNGGDGGNPPSGGTAGQDGPAGHGGLGGNGGTPENEKADGGNAATGFGSTAGGGGGGGSGYHPGNGGLGFGGRAGTFSSAGGGGGAGLCYTRPDVTGITITAAQHPGNGYVRLIQWLY